MFGNTTRRSRRQSRLVDADVDSGFDRSFEVLEELGRGKFATVKKCRSRSDGKEFAGKFIKKKRSLKGSYMCEIQNEISILQLLNHENVIKLFEVFENTIDVVLILELVTGGELFHYLIEKDKVTEEESTVYMKQILGAVQHMHSHKIVHLDLKPENIVLNSRDSKRMKIIDFGLSVKLQDGVTSRVMNGTAEFVAPEVINFDPVTCAADMWSIGVMAYVMLSGCSPFLGADNQETLANVSKSEFTFDDQDFQNSSCLSKDFIEKLLVKNPRHRATVDECLAHPWICPRDKKDIEWKRKSTINVINLRSFIARKRWRQSFHAVSLFNHLYKSSKHTNLSRKNNIATNPEIQLTTSQQQNVQRMSVIVDYDSE